MNETPNTSATSAPSPLPVFKRICDSLGYPPDMPDELTDYIGAALFNTAVLRACNGDGGWHTAKARARAVAGLNKALELINAGETAGRPGYTPEACAELRERIAAAFARIKSYTCKADQNAGKIRESLNSADLPEDPKAIPPMLRHVLQYGKAPATDDPDVDPMLIAEIEAEMMRPACLSCPPKPQDPPSRHGFTLKV